MKKLCTMPSTAFRFALAILLTIIANTGYACGNYDLEQMAKLLNELNDANITDGYYDVNVASATISRPIAKRIASLSEMCAKNTSSSSLASKMRSIKMHADNYSEGAERLQKVCPKV